MISGQQMYGRCWQPLGGSRQMWGGDGLVDAQYFLDGLINVMHQSGRQLREGTLYQPPVVDGPKLINQQIGLSSESVRGTHTKTQWLGIVHEVGGEGDNQC